MLCLQCPQVHAILADEVESENGLSKNKATMLKTRTPETFARNEFDKRSLGNVVALFTNIRMTEHGENKDILGITDQYGLQ